jgi:hypothetical protein
VPIKIEAAMARTNRLRTQTASRTAARGHHARRRASRKKLSPVHALPFAEEKI